MARASSRKFTAVEFKHEMCGTVALEMRVHEDRNKDINSLFFYIEAEAIYRNGVQVGVIPPIRAESPAGVLSKLKVHLDAQVASKTYVWDRYVRLVVQTDLHHLFYHQTPVINVEEYYFAYDKENNRWYQTATPNSPMPVVTEPPTTEKWTLCSNERLFSELHEEAKRRSDELRNKIVQLKDTEILSLQKDLEVMLGIRQPDATQETNDFERILRDYSM